MNKYLQQDTPTTETLLFKTSYIRWESICTNIPKTYGFSSWLEKGGREGQEKEKAETPNSWKASLFSKNEGIERKMTWHISGLTHFISHSRDGTGVPVDREGPGPYLPLGKAGWARWGQGEGWGRTPDPGFLTPPTSTSFMGGRDRLKPAPWGLK